MPNGPRAICVACKKEKDLPFLQDMYTGMKDSPVVRVRICAECRTDYEECVKNLNAGMDPVEAQKILEDKLTARENAA